MVRKVLPVILLSLFWSANAFAGTTAERFGGSFWEATLLLFALTPLLPAAVFIIRKKRNPIDNKYEFLYRNPYIYIFSWFFALLECAWSWFLYFIIPNLHHGIYRQPYFPHSILLGIIVCSFCQLLGAWIFIRVFCRYT